MSKRRSKGEGSIFFSPSDGRWKAQITLPNGERKGKSAKTQKEVRDWLILQRSRLNEGLFVSDEQIKVGDFLDRYINDVGVHNLRPTTLLAHSNVIKHQIKPLLGNIKLTALRPDQVQAFYTQKLNEGLSPRTVQYIHSVLHKCLNQAVKWGLVVRNVTDLVETPKPKKKNFRTWTVEELTCFLEAVQDHLWYPIYHIAAYTGMRQGEILGIHKKDVDLERGIIHVKHQITNIRGQGLVVTEPKTDKSKRPITLSKSTLEVLKAHMMGLKEDQQLIFTTKSGKPISGRNVVRHFKSVIEKTGLPEIRFHDLRHTHATLLLAAGVHPKVVQERLGHSQISLTLDTYSHVIPSLQTEAADQFEALLRSES